MACGYDHYCGKGVWFISRYRNENDYCIAGENQMTRNEIRHQIDAAYDCDRPDLVAALEEQLKALPPDAPMPITVKKLTSGEIICENRNGAMVAWIKDGKLVFDPLADTEEIFCSGLVDYPALFAELGLDSSTIQQIANCPSPAPTGA